MHTHSFENPHYPITVFAEDGPTWLEATIRRVEVAGGAFDIPAERVADIVPGGLSNEGLQTLVLSSLGFTNEEIAEHVYDTPHAVKSRRTRVENELGAAQAAQATALHFERGLYVVKTPLAPHGLTRRDREILDTTTRGLRRPDGCTELGITQNTYKTSSARARARTLKAPTTAAAVLLAHLSGELPLLQ